jgi:HEAT repeat protein
MLITVVAAVIGMIHTAKQRNRRVEAWNNVATRFTLAPVEGGLFSGEAMAGNVGGVPVRVSLVTSNKTRHTRIEVGGAPFLSPPVRIKPEADGAIGRFFQGHDEPTGDAVFDRTALIQGEPMLLHAIFDAEVRRSLMVAVGLHQGVFDEGVLTIEKNHAIDDADELATLIREAVAAVLALGAARQRSRDPAAGLAHNVKHDPEAAVRTACFRTLAQEFPNYAGLRDIAEALPEFRTADLEVLRLRHCGDAVALPALTEMARENLPLQLRGEVLRLLVQRFGYATQRELVLEALAAPSVVDRLAAVAIIAEAGDTEPVPRLSMQMLREEAEGTVGFAAALGQLGDARAEADLVRLLERPDTAVQCAAAAALGLMGTVSAVEPLLPLTEGLLRDGALKEAARDAVRRIQARLGAVEAGRLSLAEDVAGRLSVAEAGDAGATAGAVSLATTEK